jgi:Fe-S-cluster containining protein
MSSPPSVPTQRRDAYMASVDPRTAAREDSLPSLVDALNASAVVKLRRIYSVVDELTIGAQSYTACKKGCAACCHMNVSISDLEAKIIFQATGERPVRLPSTIDHDLADFKGTPCPFLKNRECSIYADRPYACRKHVSFDLSDYWCHPERSHLQEMPFVQFRAADEAYFRLTAHRSGGVFADIRDFFPRQL